MEALHDVVKAGKVRYLGASSMYAWQFAKLQHAADLGGWTRFVSMQNQYNLLRRGDEPELMAMCADMGVGLVPYSPRGRGTGPASHRRRSPGARSAVHPTRDHLVLIRQTTALRSPVEAVVSARVVPTLVVDEQQKRPPARQSQRGA
jgi:aryl-alcohol dehydrogenase-like predicted oxidoreductase